MKFAIVSVASLVSAVMAKKVVVQLMAESYCPCSGAWEAKFARDLLPKIGDLVEVQRFFDAKSSGTQHCCNPKAGPDATCMHKEQECVANRLQRCVQEHYPDYRQWLAFTNCAQGPCDRPDLQGCQYQFDVGTSTNVVREKECAANLTMDYDTINACWTGDEGVALMQKDADLSDAIDEAYGKKGLPVVWVDGKLMSTFWDCKISDGQYQETLLKTICNDSTATPLPDACSQVAQVV